MSPLAPKAHFARKSLERYLNLRLIAQEAQGKPPHILIVLTIGYYLDWETGPPEYGSICRQNTVKKEHDCN